MRTVETIKKATSQIHEHLTESADIKVVSAGLTLPVYNDDPPFHPSAIYPELRFSDVSSLANHPYRLFRNLLFELGCDRRNFGSPLWNPLHTIIQPGMTVLMKPSIDVNPDSIEYRLYAAVTHPSILRAVIDYVYAALDGTGRIVVAIATPGENSGRDAANVLRLETLQDFYFEKFRFEIEICNLRDSAFGDIPVRLNPDNETQKTAFQFDGESCEYNIPGEILSSDVFISIPKLKVHDRAGIALGLEGLTDIVSPEGNVSDCDQIYDRLLAKAERWLQHHTMSDLDWREDHLRRIIADLARIVTLADDKGRIRNIAQRNFLCVVDGIIGGENNGPSDPDPRPCGSLVIGENMLAVDMVATRMMGFDIRRLRQYDLVLQDKEEFPSTDKIEVIADGEKIPGLQFFNSEDRSPMFGFKPHPSWAGRIEV